MEFEHGLLLDHHPGDPRIGDGEQKEEPDDGTGAEVQELNAEGERQEDAGRKHVDGPFETHMNEFRSARRYLSCFIINLSPPCRNGCLR